MTIYILINPMLSNDMVLGVYDSELLAEKRKHYFKSVYPNDPLTILNKGLEYMYQE